MTDFDNAMALVKLATDPAAVKAHLAEVKAREDAAAAREQAAVQAEASLASAKAEQEAELGKREQDLRDYHAKVVERDGGADEKLELARMLYRRMGDMEKQMVRALLSRADLLSGFNEQLQTLPDLKSALALLGAPKDAHYPDDDSVMAVAYESDPIPPDNRVAGSTLTRENPRRSMRRVQPDA
jgi:hypothetical protein